MKNNRGEDKPEGEEEEKAEEPDGGEKDGNSLELVPLVVVTEVV